MSRASLIVRCRKDFHGYIGGAGSRATLKDHRAVDDIRTSTSNAMPIEGCKALARLMKAFQAKNG